MINRINLILRAKNITARQFAEEIGIQPSGMSHIMSGRNNPSLDFVTKVIRRYPEIDANWLIMGRGAMYGDMQSADTPSPQPAAPAPQTQQQENTLFADIEEPVQQPVDNIDTAPDLEPEEEEDGGNVAKVAEPSEYRPTYIAVPPIDEPSQTRSGRPRLERILFIYSDSTFREYKPQH